MNPKQPSPGWLVSQPLHPLPRTLSAVTPWSLGREGPSAPPALFPSVVGCGWLPRPQGALSCTLPPQTRPGAPCSTAHLAIAAARAHGPPELQQTRGPSRGWGFSPPSLSTFVAAPPGHPLSASASRSWRPEERGVCSGGARTRSGSPERGAGRTERSREPRGPLLQKGRRMGRSWGPGSRGRRGLKGR